MRAHMLNPLMAAVLLPAALAIATASAYGDTIFVCWDGSGDYLTIQEGIDAAQDGDEVVVCDGTYTGPRDGGLRGFFRHHLVSTLTFFASKASAAQKRSSKRICLSSVTACRAASCKSQILDRLRLRDWRVADILLVQSNSSGSGEPWPIP